MIAFKSAYPALILAILAVLAYYQFSVSHPGVRESVFSSPFNRTPEALRSSESNSTFLK